MEILKLNDYSKVYLFGDIHGEFPSLNRTINNNSSTKEEEDAYYAYFHQAGLSSQKKKKIRPIHTTFNNSVIIVAGDCGLGFNKEEYYTNLFEAMNKMLVEINAHLIFVRGNHDDPSYFNGKINYSNIKAVKDYTVIMTENENILCVGGAISVDRSWRISKEEYINRFAKSHRKPLYWKDEAPYFNNEAMDEIAENGIEINFVVTHSVPSFINLNMDKDIKGWEENDPKLHLDIQNERHVFDNIYNFLIEKDMPLKGWYFGHYHTNYNTESDEFIPFLGMADDFNYHNIYECLENGEDKLAMKSKPRRFGMEIPHFEMPQRLEVPHFENNLQNENRENIYERMRRQLEENRLRYEPIMNQDIRLDAPTDGEEQVGIAVDRLDNGAGLAVNNPYGALDVGAVPNLDYGNAVVNARRL